MMSFIQLIIGFICAGASAVLLFLIVTSELDFRDLRFAGYFGFLMAIAAICFFVALRNPDNEETNPGKEKPRR